MPTVTQDQFYRELLEEVRYAIGEVQPSAVYLSAIAQFDGVTPRTVQIVPGVPVCQTPDSGIGLVRETFRVACWARLLTDHGNDDTALITDRTLGLLALANDVRRILTQTTIASITTEPIVWMQGSTINTSADQPGWGFVTDEYRVGYELAWSVT